MYILLEGVDTVGKSTQIEFLKHVYPSAIFTKEPGGTQLGEDIRDIVLSGKKVKSKVAEMFLFLADRAEHSFEVIRQNQNDMIISDRGFLSGIGYAIDVPLDMAIMLNLIALNGANPNKVILLELSKDELSKRLSSKKNDAIEDRGVEYLLNVQTRMKQAIVDLKLNAKIIDASKSIQDVSNEILDFINSDSC